MTVRRSDVEGLVGNDRWEDVAAAQRIMAALPGWKLIRIIRAASYGQTLIEMEEFCRENCRDEWKRVGWSSGCSSTVGMAFKDTVDAVLFRLRFSEISQ